MTAQEFVEDYLSRLREIKTEADVASLYNWLWSVRDELSAIVGEFNSELDLRDKFELKPDLPCIAVGSLHGLVFVSANPGWKEKLNPREDSHCRASSECYKDLMFHYFKEHPRVVGERVRWWSQPIALLPMVRGYKPNVLPNLKPETVWNNVDQSHSLGGWELFPFHSESDGVTSRLDVKWLRQCLDESLKAIVRIAPATLVVASASGFDLIRSLTPELEWYDRILVDTKMAYATAGTTEIVALRKQIFSAPRKFTNLQLIAAVEAFRQHSRF